MARLDGIQSALDGDAKRRVELGVIGAVIAQEEVSAAVAELAQGLSGDELHALSGGLEQADRQGSQGGVSEAGAGEQRLTLLALGGAERALDQRHEDRGALRSVGLGDLAAERHEARGRDLVVELLKARGEFGRGARGEQQLGVSRGGVAEREGAAGHDGSTALGFKRCGGYGGCRRPGRRTLCLQRAACRLRGSPPHSGGCLDRPRCRPRRG